MASQLRAVSTGEEDLAVVPGADSMLWHVTLTTAGPRLIEKEIRSALERLSHEHPFLLSGRYAPDRAEVRYWEEAVDIAAAVTMALSLWGDYRESAQLPAWETVGVEVVNKDTFRRRGQMVQEQPGLLAAGRLLPF